MDLEGLRGRSRGGEEAPRRVTLRVKVERGGG